MVRRRRSRLEVKDSDMLPKQCLEHGANDGDLMYNETPQEPQSSGGSGNVKKRKRRQKRRKNLASETPLCSVPVEQEKKSVPSADHLDQAKIPGPESEYDKEEPVDSASTLEDNEHSIMTPVQCMAQETIWRNKHRIDEAERLFYERLCASQHPTQTSEETPHCSVTAEQENESVPSADHLDQAKIPGPESEYDEEEPVDSASTLEDIEHSIMTPVQCMAQTIWRNRNRIDEAERLFYEWLSASQHPTQTSEETPHCSVTAEQENDSVPSADHLYQAKIPGPESEYDKEESVDTNPEPLNICLSSPGCFKKMRQRVSKFFKRVKTSCTCCWRPNVKE